MAGSNFLFSNALQVSQMMPQMMPPANIGSEVLIHYYNNPVEQTFNFLLYKFINIINYTKNVTATLKGEQKVVEYEQVSPLVFKYLTYDGFPDAKADMVVHNFSTLVESIRRYTYYYTKLGYPQTNFITIRKHLGFLSPFINILLRQTVKLSLLLNWDCLTLIFKVIYNTVDFATKKNRTAQQIMSQFSQQDRVIKALQAEDWTKLTLLIDHFFKTLRQTYFKPEKSLEGGVLNIPYYVNEVYRVIKEDGGLDLEVAPYSLHELLLQCGFTENSELLVLGSGITGATCFHAASLLRMKQVVGIETKRSSWMSCLSHLWKVLARGLLQTPMFFANGNSSSLNTFSPFTHVIIQDETLLNSFVLPSLPPSLSHVITFTPLPKSFHEALQEAFLFVNEMQVRLYGTDQWKVVYIYTRLDTPNTTHTVLAPPLSSLPFYVDWSSLDTSWFTETFRKSTSDNTEGIQAVQQGLVSYLRWIRQLLQSSRGGLSGGAQQGTLYYYNGTFCDQVPYGQSVDFALPNLYTSPESCDQSKIVSRLPLLDNISERESNWLNTNFGVLNESSSGGSGDNITIILLLPGWDMVWYRLNWDPAVKTSYFLQHNGQKTPLYPIVYNVGTW